ncbi:flagellar motor switch protein FliM [Arthrobacter sp. AL08]|uniref:flagellar motor switch protein FliM n=1 Tax=Micrococcaceae TaxID=1268 RepID=UPI001CFF7727|nr:MULTISPECIES: flagellar motor switch protein FliM [Micrococcaceae]MDD1475648.1 flagellar motor switch protein FliM [Arthrobacter sp. H16F315]MCB5283786.1 Flagellar motor switch protein FliM [Arthrobacter sp. ES1]MDI3242950.1 flagellar motor switch protein FliM [Arthrobacter sp. AL05]MDI3278980.1 flagellar motor switch protein FliM [Arthrobacter sp. AL08]MDJ0353343.1 flagellar motor switch protein FliM [Pseudarthrobacter sp. PH31-O2]
MSVIDEREVVRERTLSVYDFRRPATLAREHSRVLELAFETFARQWGTQLTAKVRVKSVVRLEDVSMLSYDEYAASIPAVTAMVLCAVEGNDSKLVVQFPSPSALGWVNRMLGASADSPMPDRKFTQIEQALVQGLMNEALEDLSYSLGPLLNEAVRVDTIQYNSQFAQAAAPSELMIVASFTMIVGDISAPATLAIPADVLLGRLKKVNPTDSREDAPVRIGAQLEQVPVELSVRLSTSFITPSRVLGLAVGDVLPLPHLENRPFDVTLDGTRLATAAPARNGSRAAAVIVTIEENP